MEFTPENLYEEAEKLYVQEGYSCTKIEQVLGLNRKKVSAYLRSKDIKVKVIAGNHNKEEIQAKYTKGEEMFLKGRSLRNTSKELKISRAGFSNWLKQRGHIIKAKNNFKSIDLERKLLTAENLFNKTNALFKSAKEANVSFYVLSRYLEEKGYDLKREIYKVDESIFEKIDTSIKAYWLGMLYADAYVDNFKNVLEFCLKEGDRSHVEKFKGFLQANNSIKTKKGQR
ncbi:hypothetical protein RWE15_22965 [Virgibacillus halophilus]|uniref:Uncharacterized protein n=1 Tax=Tigheibacillus halophilus TaxID=361280 RepID=A0ABU5CBE5_9BACI|nr:hypothetical protein [Virgibacillus halophilus]